MKRMTKSPEFASWDELPEVRAQGVYGKVSYQVKAIDNMNKSYHQLKYLESTQNLRSAIQRTSNRRLSAALAQTICTYIQQGRLFLDNAANAPNEIRPLLIYYAISAFSKAIVCVRTRRFSLPSSHGLSDVSADNSKLEALTAKIGGNGLFQAFNDVIKETEGICYFQNAVAYKHNTPTASSTVMDDDRVSLKEVLSRIGDTLDMYEQTFNEKANCQHIHLYIYQNDVTLSMLSKQMYTDRQSLITMIGEMRNRFPALNDWYVNAAFPAYGKSQVTFSNKPYDLATNFDENVFIHNPETDMYAVDFSLHGPVSNENKVFTEIVGTVGGGQRLKIGDSQDLETSHFVVPLNGKFYSELSLRLIGMFILSSLVRYRPQIWIHSLSHLATQQRPLDDQMIALIEKFIDSTVDAFVESTEVVCGVRTV